MAKGQRALVVQVGGLYVRDYPLRFAGDWTLTASPARVAKFYSKEVAEQAAAELTAAGLPAEILIATPEGGGR